MSSVPGAHFNNISWPSLYSPGIEVKFTGPAVRPGGYYLSDPDDIFKFTLYWTLIFHIPLCLVAGVYAFLNFLFPPARSGGEEEAVLATLGARSHTHSHSYTPVHLRLDRQSHPHSHSYSWSQSQSDSPQGPLPVDEWLKPRVNPRRSRLTFALFVLLAFLGVGLLGAVVGAAVVACVLVGVYRAGGFYMSTWIPFIWAVIQSLIALLEIWPSIIDII